MAASVARSASTRASIDYSLLAEQLNALAYPARLELLEILKIPHLLSEIRLTPQRIRPGENPDRPAAKPTVQAHVDKLVEADFLRVENVGSPGRKTYRYGVNASRLYALVEDLRRVSTIYAGRPAPADETGTLPAAGPAVHLRGPRLVLVHGVYEGKNYSLVSGDRWVVGRRLDADIALDYDGYVSVDHAEIRRVGKEFHLRDLRSKNGTTVNWVPVAAGQAHTLKPADVVGVGRSLLVFAPE